MITDLLGASSIQPDVSFEFFPPNTEIGVANLTRSAEELATLNPKFVSVTYGAGGTSRDRTQLAVSHLTATTNLAVAGHLTCVGATRAEVAAVIDDYLAVGVRHIVALRGDPPEGTESIVPGGYQDAVELVAGIRSHVEAAGIKNFQISVGAYPEVHPKASSPRSDLDNLKAKLDAGADRALTQFFFDSDVFLDFVDRARVAGIEAPLVPGIMPINNFAGINRFASRAGASVPRWMHDLFDGLDDNPEVRNLVSAQVTAEQCRRLVAGGVSEFHFYTMNRSELSLATCRALGIRPNEAVAPGPPPIGTSHD
ncbi:MAG: methylenetetrahydrofolate reductase [NAD(P)H] [Actinomycetota bacterium]|nr:methylenetetrahydrofolate reductase [NAD(P)H] [Actinomycetota bacterium]